MSDLVLLEAILHEIRGLRADLQAQRAPAALSQADLDREWLRAARPALQRVHSFTSAVLLARAAMDPGLPLAEYLGRGRGGTMALGRRLARLAAQHVVVDGFVLEGRGEYRGCPVYALRTSRTSPAGSPTMAARGLPAEVPAQIRQRGRV